MPETYNDFNRLLEQDGESKRYFASLPNGVKQAVSSHPESIRSFENLHHFTEDLLNHK